LDRDGRHLNAFGRSIYAIVSGDLARFLAIIAKMTHKMSANFGSHRVEVFEKSFDALNRGPDQMAYARR
jgi:hypothetical protein